MDISLQVDGRSVSPAEAFMDTRPSSPFSPEDCPPMNPMRSYPRFAAARQWLEDGWRRFQAMGNWGRNKFSCDLIYDEADTGEGCSTTPEIMRNAACVAAEKGLVGVIEYLNWIRDSFLETEKKAGHDGKTNNSTCGEELLGKYWKQLKNSLSIMLGVRVSLLLFSLGAEQSGRRQPLNRAENP